jgi:hypothetical protein
MDTLTQHMFVAYVHIGNKYMFICCVRLSIIKYIFHKRSIVHLYVTDAIKY